MDQESARRELYPAIEPYNSGLLPVGDGHEIYFEECGNPQGKAAVLLHGGPGAGCSPAMRRFYDPQKYRIVLFDQRGCGRSTPHASLRANTTWDLVADIERLRSTLNIDRWQVFGGSWGSTLALAYAETHPAQVTELVLRGIFLGTEKEQHWIYQFGASEIYPEEWQAFIEPILEAERSDIVQAYYRRLLDAETREAQATASAWSTWEVSVLSLLPNPEVIAAMSGDKFVLAIAKIECHYFVHRCFFDDGQLLRDINQIKHIPAVIVQGRYDVLCPPVAATTLAAACPAATLQIIGDAGHSAFEPGIVDALIGATDAFAE